MNAFFGIGADRITISGEHDIIPIDQWSLLIEKTQLDELQIMTIQTRVISVVKAIQFRLLQYSIAYTVLRTCTTVGSILIPSLLAFQNTATPEAINIGMWALGLMVGFSNAFMSLFKIDKNYFSLGELLEKIESEAWMYISLSGRYREIPSALSDDIRPNYHKEYFHVFIERCEYLLHKAVRSELQQSVKQTAQSNLGGGASMSVGGESTGSNLYIPLPRYRQILESQTQLTGKAGITTPDSPDNEIVNAHLEDEQFIASNGGGASVPHIRPTSSTARNPGLDPEETIRGRV